MKFKKLHHDIDNNTKIFGYCRTSTTRQKNGLGAQKLLIEAYAKQHGLVIDGWFEDFAVSTNKVPIYERKGYMEMENRLNEERRRFSDDETKYINRWF